MPLVETSPVRTPYRSLYRGCRGVSKAEDTTRIGTGAAEPQAFHDRWRPGGWCNCDGGGFWERGDTPDIVVHDPAAVVPGAAETPRHPW